MLPSLATLNPTAGWWHRAKPKKPKIKLTDEELKNLKDAIAENPKAYMQVAPDVRKSDEYGEMLAMKMLDVLWDSRGQMTKTEVKALLKKVPEEIRNKPTFKSQYMLALAAAEGNKFDRDRK